MDYQQFYGKYGPESRVHDRMEGFGMPMPLLSRIQATPGSWEFFAQLSPQLQNRMAAMCVLPTAPKNSSGGSNRSAKPSKPGMGRLSGSDLCSQYE